MGGSCSNLISVFVEYVLSIVRIDIEYIKNPIKPGKSCSMLLYRFVKKGSRYRVFKKKTIAAAVLQQSGYQYTLIND
jgi:hypothetical protein